MRLRIELASGNKMATRWVDILNTTPKDFYDVAEKKLKECFDELNPTVAVMPVMDRIIAAPTVIPVEESKEVKVTKKKPKGKRC